MMMAILLTCYNRKEKTVNCIKKLLPQLEKLNCSYKFYICDDKSMDGSYEILKEMLPDHTIIQSNGNLYWSKGMYTVMEMAVADSCDFYLMVNDDVDFLDDALETMFSSYYKAEISCGITGSTISGVDGRLTYGGRINQNDSHPVRPQEPLQTCEYANWNCFLIDKEVVEKVGCIDGQYRHGFGDYDYSLRMRRNGIPIFVAANIIGYCEKNSNRGTFHDESLSRSQRFISLFSPKGLPFASYMRYHIRCEGKNNIIKYIYGYMSLIWYIIRGKEIK